MTTCQECKGHRRVSMMLRDPSGRTPTTPCVVEHVVTCPTCRGKGYTDEADRRRYLHSMGVLQGCPA